MKKKMKALSIRQPYVEQILTGEKKIEYRTVNTTFRGKFYIYSSKKFAFGGSLEEFKNLPTGVIVGTAELVDVIPSWSDNIPKDFGDKPDNYEWILKNPIRLKRPLKVKNKPQPVWFNPF